MKYSEAIQHYEDNDAKNIVVRSKSGKEYELHRDIVEACEEMDGDRYVYGGYWERKKVALRPSWHHKWFYLSNVEFVRAGTL